MTDPMPKPDTAEVLFDPRPQPDEHPVQRAILHDVAETAPEREADRDEAGEGEDRPEGEAEPERDAERQERLLDEGVEETFPASDPVSVKRVD